MNKLATIQRAIVRCKKCPRLVAWTREGGCDKPRRFQDDAYWSRPVPGFGPEDAGLMVVGLAPGAHGANRTGRVFTGDRSGDFLYAALHRAGLANQPTAVGRNDGLELKGVYVTCAVRCAPPDNKPSPGEQSACLPFLGREFEALPQVRAVLALGAIAWNAVLAAARERGLSIPQPRPKFAHGASADLGAFTMFGSYHVSQQNTFTGRLTEAMFDRVLTQAWATACARSSADGRALR